MNDRNFDREMNNIMDAAKEKGVKPTLLMHSCCAPCSTSCLERVKDYFDVTVYYYNPNLDTVEEFNHRATEQQRLCKELKVNCVVEEYDKSEFLSAVIGLEDCLEGGARCAKCFELRLKRTAEKAKELGAEYFTTTLTVSPLKNAKLINAIGEKIGKDLGVKFLPSDFKKQNGYKRSVELSKEFDLYRQNYCGCEFSKR